MRNLIVAFALTVFTASCSYAEKPTESDPDACYSYKFHLTANLNENNPESVHYLKETLFFIPTKRLAVVGPLDQTRKNYGTVHIGNAVCYYESGKDDRLFIPLHHCDGIDINGQTIPAGTKIQISNTDSTGVKLNWCWYKLGRAMNPMD